MIRRATLMRASQFAVTTALIALLLWQLDMEDALARLSTAAPGWLLAAVAMLIVHTWLAAFRWQVTARLFGIAIGTQMAIREYFLTQIVNQCLPGGMMGDVGRAVRTRDEAGLMRAGQSVFIERLWGQIASFVLMLVAVGLVWAVPDGLELPLFLVAPIGFAALGAGVAALVVITAPALPGLAGRTAERMSGVLRQGLMSPGTWPSQAMLSLAAVSANLLAFAFCARATGTQLSASATLTIVPLILFTMVVPLSVSGWGLREGAAAALFPLLGASPEAGLTASVTFGLAFLVSSLPGLPVLLLERAAGDDAPPETDPPASFDTPAVAPAQRPPRIRSTRR